MLADELDPPPPSGHRNSRILHQSRATPAMSKPFGPIAGLVHIKRALGSTHGFSSSGICSCGDAGSGGGPIGPGSFRPDGTSVSSPLGSSRLTGLLWARIRLVGFDEVSRAVGERADRGRAFRVLAQGPSSARSGNPRPSPGGGQRPRAVATEIPTR